MKVIPRCQGISRHSDTKVLCNLQAEWWPYSGHGVYLLYWHLKGWFGFVCGHKILTQFFTVLIFQNQNTGYSSSTSSSTAFMGLLPDTLKCGLRMRRECRERFPRHRIQRKPLVSDPDMHRGTCVTHVPWCMSGSLTRSGGENVPGIPGAWANRNFTYLVRGPLYRYYHIG